MPRINIKKFSYNSGDELILCPHCKRKYLYSLKWHFEKRPKKDINGRLIIPLELMKTKCYDCKIPALCSKCTLFPKCVDCEIILCEWKKHWHSWSSDEDPRYCEMCWFWKISSYPQA